MNGSRRTPSTNDPAVPDKQRLSGQSKITRRVVGVNVFVFGLWSV